MSPGCWNCYARKMTERWGGKFDVRRRTSVAYWRNPLKWNKQADASGRPVRVFLGSMCDWLDPLAPDAWLADTLKMMENTPFVTWLTLTKRPDLWERRLNDVAEISATARRWLGGRAPYNVWVGVTAENEEAFVTRTEALRNIPAALRWVSAEPLLENVCVNLGDRMLDRIDWVVAGGENGTGARPCEVKWLMELQWRCEKYCVPFFWKQWGENSVWWDAVVCSREELTRWCVENNRMWPVERG